MGAHVTRQVAWRRAGLTAHRALEDGLANRPALPPLARPSRFPISSSPGRLLPAPLAPYHRHRQLLRPPSNRSFPRLTARLVKTWSKAVEGQLRISKGVQRESFTMQAGRGRVQSAVAVRSSGFDGLDVRLVKRPEERIHFLTRFGHAGLVINKLFWSCNQ